MKTNHTLNSSSGTPGPWTVERINTKYPDLFEYNIIAPNGWTDPDTGEVKRCGVASSLDCPHDAALIAAAPDLLAALQALAPILDNDGPLVKAYAKVEPLVLAALAKATAS